MVPSVKSSRDNVQLDVRAFFREFPRSRVVYFMAPEENMSLSRMHVADRPLSGGACRMEGEGVQPMYLSMYTVTSLTTWRDTLAATPLS
jgi:hypothetical protein